MTAATALHVAITRYRTGTPDLPTPLADEWDWQLDGRCRGNDPAVFYPPADTRGRALASAETAAKRICQRCSVVLECRSYAIDAGEPYGIWGGTTAKERALLALGEA